MKRDMDLILEILKILEAEATDRSFSFEEGEAEMLKCTLDEVRYNLQQAEQMGLIEVGSKPLNGEWQIRGLTPSGRDFVERCRSRGQNYLDSAKLPAALDAVRAKSEKTRGELLTLKAPEHITLVEGFAILHSSGLSTEVAKTRLKQAFQRKAIFTEPQFAFEYDEAEIDWTTGYVKIPRKKERFRPTLLRSDFDRYFFKESDSPRSYSHMAEQAPSRRVFIVHGHNEAAREAVARFLEKIGFEVAILHEQTDQGQTIIEKFEANADVGFVVVLLTPDDQGGKIGEAAQKRAVKTSFLSGVISLAALDADTCVPL